MGKPKNSKSKNNPDERNSTKKVVIRTSHECSQCKNKCQNGIDYMNNMIPGRAYNGIACVK